MGLADEMAQAQSGQAPEVSTPQVPVPQAPLVDTSAIQQIMQADADQANSQEPVAQAAPAPEATIRIGDKEFASQAEAIEYAKQLQVERDKDQAFLEGYKQGQPIQETEQPKGPDFFEQVGEEIWENPAEALKKVHEKAKQEALVNYEATQKAAKEQEAAWAKLWQADPMFASNKALITDYLVPQHLGEIGNMAFDKAFPVLVEKLRGDLNHIQKSLRTQTELPNGSAITTPATGNTVPQATNNKVETEAMDMISIVNRNRKRGRLNK